MLAYLGDAEAAGAMLALRSPLQQAAVRGDGFEVRVAGADPIACSVLVNSAGLRAPSVAKSIDGYPPHLAPRELYAKGNYYSLTRRSPFSRLVYPVPEPGGLGVHVTLDLGGQARFGPDVEWVERIDYDVDPRRADKFYAAIRRYWPGLRDGALAPGYAGIRPKTSGPGEPASDFEIQGTAKHGVRGLVQLYGIESPGLTASLALARQVREELR
jgi:L-2-hydroxyglutarate oxidase LhgO